MFQILLMAFVNSCATESLMEREGTLYRNNGV